MGQGKQTTGQLRAVLHPAQPNSISKRSLQLNSYLNAFYKQGGRNTHKKSTVVNVNHLAGFTTTLLTSHLSSFSSSLFFFGAFLDQNIYSSLATLLSGTGKLSWNHGRKRWRKKKDQQMRANLSQHCLPPHPGAGISHLGSPEPS